MQIKYVDFVQFLHMNISLGVFGMTTNDTAAFPFSSWSYPFSNVIILNFTNLLKTEKT